MQAPGSGFAIGAVIGRNTDKCGELGRAGRADVPGLDTATSNRMSFHRRQSQAARRPTHQASRRSFNLSKKQRDSAVACRI